jgi:RecB family endonuclease NucS
MKNIIVKFLAATALIAFAFVAAPTLQAADKALPLTPTITKVASAEKPPFVLKLKNDSKETLKVSAQVLLSVAAHNADKARNIPAEVVEPGQTMTIADLAALDVVTVTADGYAPLKVEVK